MAMELRSDQLAIFLEVCQRGGFSKAAAALGQTQSSVSQRISALEAEVGERLLVRDRRQTRPTEAGRVLLLHAARVKAELDRARQALLALDGALSGSLALGATDTLATYVLPPVLAAFQRRYPGVELRLDNRPSPAIAARVAERSLDLGLVTLPLPEVLELRQQALLEQREVAIFAPGDPLTHRQRVDREALLGRPLVLLDRTTGSRAHLEAWWKGAKRRPEVAMEMSSLEVLKRLVELGFGVSVVPALAVERELAEGRLMARPLTGPTLKRQVGLVLPPSPAESTRAARAFAALAKEMLRPRRSSGL
ncbi:MAG: LysR family transcriptional regulator [Myxococcota bacterium]